MLKFLKDLFSPIPAGHEDHTVAFVDNHTVVLRPAGLEQPIGRLLRNAYIDEDNLVFVFDGYIVTMVRPAAVTVKDGDHV